MTLMTRALSRKRRAIFALAAVTIAFALSFLVLLSIDIFLHGRFEKSAGFNIWGYRGPAVPKKKQGEYRVVVLGGSSAYGYGVTWDRAMPAALERKLDEVTVPRKRFTVINLGYNNEGAYSFAPTLQDYLWLRYDLACLYEGYNDVMGDPRSPNLSVFRHESPVFRLTGYLPIFPMIFKEKAAAILHGGDIGAAYHDSKTVFRPGLAARATAGALNAAAGIGASFERQLGRVSVEAHHEITDVASTGCKYPWQEYCRSMLVAIEFALQHNTQVLIVTQPYDSRTTYVNLRHREQQREMAAMLSRRFAGDPRVRYLNFGERVDLTNPALSFDRMHLTADGNERLAGGLVQPVLEMADGRQP